MGRMPRIVVIGGGPAGYESALVAAQLGADVTVVDRDGLGGSCVLTDCVPSKTLIATSDRVTALRDAPRVGISAPQARREVDLAAVNARIKDLAAPAVRRHPAAAAARGRQDRRGDGTVRRRPAGARAPHRGRRR